MTSMKAEDPYDLQRFIAAQDAGGTYEHAVAELRSGRKSSHWMWFVFPQIAGLGYSPAARTYAITSLAEARAYLAHPVLGARLAECAAILTGVSGRTAEQIFGEVDAMKLRSSMTLFMRAAPGEPAFRQVLDHYFDGIPDSVTEQRILNPAHASTSPSALWWRSTVIAMPALKRRAGDEPARQLRRGRLGPADEPYGQGSVPGDEVRLAAAEPAAGRPDHGKSTRTTP
jgi:uncharacterized protein (DUF1810 family)